MLSAEITRRKWQVSTFGREHATHILPIRLDILVESLLKMQDMLCNVFTSDLTV